MRIRTVLLFFCVLLIAFLAFSVLMHYVGPAVGWW
jgi:hypothetical protein